MGTQEGLEAFCQACAMPMHSPTDFGLLAEGYRQDDYCHDCFAGGTFTQSHLTLKEMIDVVVGPWAQATGRPEADVRSEAEAARRLPALKRWRAAAAVAG